LTTFASEPTLGRNQSGLLMLKPNPMPGRYHVGLSWDQGYKPNLKVTPDMSAAMVSGERAVDFRFYNPTVLSPPKDETPAYQWQRAVEYSAFPDWPAVSRYFAPLYAKAATVSSTSPIKAEAARIAAAQKLPMERANAALKLVQQDV